MLEYDRKQMGDQVRAMRETASFTQAELAERLGYTSAQFISNIERGISVAPLPLLAKLARICKANPEKFVAIIMVSQKKILMQKFKR
ncbi:MAG: helix-turn-helix domain-containing protein [Bdellovibrionales bacterium]